MLYISVKFTLMGKNGEKVFRKLWKKQILTSKLLVHYSLYVDFYHLVHTLNISVFQFLYLYSFIFIYIQFQYL